jgi:hypothetical protein
MEYFCAQDWLEWVKLLRKTEVSIRKSITAFSGGSLPIRRPRSFG